MSTTYLIETPAKLNIRLKVTGRRPDGYHELVSIMTPISLFDRLEMTVTQGGAIELSCDGLPVPSDETNLVQRAARTFFAETGFKAGVSVRLKKTIPVAAGMGGGSSDAAAILWSLNEIFSRPLGRRALHALATRLGADVPFFLYCKTSLATGIGDILEPLGRWPELWYVVITPPLEISTAWVYGHLKLELTAGEYEYIIDFLNKDTISVSHLLENDLEKVTSARYPIIDLLKRSLVDAGAESALMTGSGPSVFGLFPSLERAESAKQDLSSKGLGSVYAASNWETPPSLKEIHI